MNEKTHEIVLTIILREEDIIYEVKIIAVNIGECLIYDFFGNILRRNSLQTYDMGFFDNYIHVYDKLYDYNFNLIKVLPSSFMHAVLEGDLFYYTNDNLEISVVYNEFSIKVNNFLEGCINSDNIFISTSPAKVSVYNKELVFIRDISIDTEFIIRLYATYKNLIVFCGDLKIYSILLT